MVKGKAYGNGYLELDRAQDKEYENERKRKRKIEGQEVSLSKNNTQNKYQ